MYLTPLTYLWYNFRYKIIIEIHFNRDFVIKNHCQRWDLNPQPSDLGLLARDCLEFTLNQSLSPYWLPEHLGS